MSAGVLTGLIGLLVQVIRLTVAGLRGPTPLGLEVGWLNAPLVDGLTFGGVALVLAIAARWFPRLVPFRVVMFALSFLAFASLLLLVEPWATTWTATFALVVLAAGVAVQIARLLQGREAVAVQRSRTVGGLLAAVAILLALVSTEGPSVAEAARRTRLPAAPAGAPNVLVIVMDTVRAESLSAYGFPEPTTPWLEQFASRSVLFEHAFSTSPWTLPSHSAMFTGRRPSELSADWEAALDDRHATLAEIFAQRGYLTGAFVANYDYAGARTGLDRGFIEYDDHTAVKVLAGHTFDARDRTSSTLGRIAPDRVRRILDDLAHKNAPAVNREFLGWLSGRGDRPVFAFLNYFDAHSPYRSPKEFDAKFRTGGRGDRFQNRRDDYEGCIAFLDQQLGELFKQLDATGFLQNTVVVVTSDHGELFGEHGVIRHGNSLYRPALEVPLVVSRPGHVPAGVRVRDVVSLHDIAATVLDLADAGTHENVGGQSLRRYWTAGNAGQAPAPEPVLSEVSIAVRQESWLNAKGPMVSVVDRGMHYIKTYGLNREELFDFVNDPLETRDLSRSAGSAAVMSHFRSQLTSFAAPRSPLASQPRTIAVSDSASRSPIPEEPR